MAKVILVPTNIESDAETRILKEGTLDECVKAYNAAGKYGSWKEGEDQERDFNPDTDVELDADRALVVISDSGMPVYASS